MDDHHTAASSPGYEPPGGTDTRGRKVRMVFGLNPFKVLFAMEYVLQGLANPFQGITYQSFFKHFRFTYGLSEAATQNFFSRSYLAWSFKPVIGFLMDAFGKTKVVLTFLLLAGGLMYFVTPFVDTSAVIFFGMMFALSILFACTDVAVDRATVITGDEEAKSTGKSRAATVGLNQAICWAAIYGTSIVAGASGGFIADNVPIRYLMYALAAVPGLVFLVVLRLPRDRAASTPIPHSVANFWNGLNTGPIMWIIVFYFLFHFQPALGALWTNYAITTLKFTQSQLGYADGVAYTGYFFGVLIFAWLGIKWQDRFGLRNVFKVFILLSIAVNLTQYALVEPWFTRITSTIHARLPGADPGAVRWAYYAGYNFFMSILISLIRMSTFSLVGAVIPVNAAGSLFAGFMSVANLAYSFSYASGSWLYYNGLKIGVFRTLQRSLFSLPAYRGDKMSIALLILVGSTAYLLSFVAVHMLPDRRHTQSSDDTDHYLIGPEHFNVLGPALLRRIGWVTGGAGLALFGALYFAAGIDLIAGVIVSFFLATFARKMFLDQAYKHRSRSARTDALS
jgi:MFS family permease